MVYRERDCSKVNSSFWCVLVGGGVGLDVPSPPPPRPSGGLSHGLPQAYRHSQEETRLPRAVPY